MDSYYQKKAKKRTFILLSLFLIWLVVIIFRLVRFQIIEYSYFKTKVTAQNQNIEPVIPKRGTIFDRSGVILARSVPRQSVFYIPFKEEPIELQLEKIQKLKTILDLSGREFQIIKQRIEKNKTFIWIKRKIDPEKVKKVKDLAHSGTGIYLREENKRFYPHGDLGSHIIGRVNIDDAGASGIEFKHNSVLAGEQGKSLILRDAKRKKYRLETIKEPISGKDVYLTIDETIQYIAQKALQKAVDKASASWGSVIISKPDSGEILGMATYPTSDLNQPPPNQELIRNRAIHHIFDPGSTFKIITASAALETKKVSLTDTFDCSEGAIHIAGKTIRDHHRYEILSFPEVIINSSNVGTIQVGMRVGDKDLYKTINQFGFGQRTGIDLPGEERGIFRNLDRWTSISIASLSIGYEISVTAIQMLQAINIIANKGVSVPPRIVKKTSESYENTNEMFENQKRVISRETASTISSILQEVVRKGTGTAAQIKGYSIAGKTGTAQKLNPSTKQYSSSQHAAIFVGFVPAEKPFISIIVIIDSPKGPYYGGLVAAPVFREISAQILRYCHIPPKKEPSQTLVAAKNWRTDTE